MLDSRVPFMRDIISVSLWRFSSVSISARFVETSTRRLLYSTALLFSVIASAFWPRRTSFRLSSRRCAVWKSAFACSRALATVSSTTVARCSFPFWICARSCCMAGHSGL